MCLSILEGWVFELKAESARFVRHDRLPDGAGGGVRAPKSISFFMPWMCYSYSVVSRATRLHKVVFIVGGRG